MSAARPGPEQEPVFEKAFQFPLGYTFSVRARPSTIRRTVLRLLPWALYLAVPQGRLARIAFWAAMRVSPLFKQKMR